MKSSNLYKCKLLAASCCLLPLTGFAAEDSSKLNYGYVEADYINFDIDQPNEKNIFSKDFDNGGGYGISLSLPVGKNFFLYGDYSKTKSDFTFIDNTRAIVPGNTDLLRLNLGVGFIMPIIDGTDLVVSGGYSDIDYNSFRFGATSSATLNDLNDDPSDGYTVDVKIRSMFSQAVEGGLGVRYTDIESTDGFSIIGNVMFKLSSSWALNVSVDAGDELITYGAGIRYMF